MSFYFLTLGELYIPFNRRRSINPKKIVVCISHHYFLKENTSILFKTNREPGSHFFGSIYSLLLNYQTITFKIHSKYLVYYPVGEKLI